MKRNLLCLALLSVIPEAGAITRYNELVPGLPVFQVEAGDTRAVVHRSLTRMLDAGRPFALIGDTALVSEAMAGEVNAWPETGAWVIDPRDGLGIHGIVTIDADTRTDAFSRWQEDKGADPEPRGRTGRVRFNFVGQRDVALTFDVSSPGAVCRAFSRQMYDTLFGNTSPDAEDRRAFYAEVRRWCQYGDLSYYAAAPRSFVIEPFHDTRDVLLTLTTEWAFIRSEDSAQPARVTYSMWAKTVGDGGGFGFTHRSGTEGYIDKHGNVRNLMDVAIHSGWGGLADRETITAWPLNSTFPFDGNTLVYECDGLDAHLRFDCPFMPRVRRLYPQDTHDGSVAVTNSTRMDVVGNARLTTSPTRKVTFGIDLTYGETKTTETTMSMVRIHSNADTVNHRTTRWMPNLSAISRWFATYDFGGLAWATPLATTLNPHYEILWEVPLMGNEGRVVPYYMIYEAGMNQCNASANCSGWKDRQIGTLPGKARVAWFDAVMLRFPNR
ncbi:MAG: hypothetical protein GAK28_03522 [Luteibacter sp.]|uniref:hypothetical protein n=1 Tax=Luteibacter sp. TaxID=1886636 RepID=UPI00137C5E4A|nr:hypothetical protein [Luteibacter sp.]KAF1005079.1 MAG: hypothetical protein GAK28_03522 [Luteibacter sp.]